MWRGEVKQISWSPRAFVFKGLLSDKECDYLISNVRTSPDGSYRDMHVNDTIQQPLNISSAPFAEEILPHRPQLQQEACFASALRRMYTIC